MRKREISPFSLSFLDVMFCGFGAVVLLVMLLSGQVLQKREEEVKDLQGEVVRVTALYDSARALLSRERRDIAAAEKETANIELQIKQLRVKLQGTQQKAKATSEALREKEREIRKLEKARTALKNAKEILESKEAAKPESGASPIKFAGEGKRQYLTGLKLDGDRTLILVDASASMLDKSIVNIVRRKLSSAASRRGAPKWRRVVRSAHWLIANLHNNKQFQLYFFNTEAQPAIAGTDNRWLATSNAGQRTRSIDALRQVAPERGTSLHKAFAVARRLNPPPDNIILLTDGLPTQGIRATGTSKVSGEERIRLFENAIVQLPKGIHVNTILFPIEGDPAAAEAFWRLAIATQGSFMTPASNWP
jgi:hypothetical protein